jgi:type II secretory pathway pseudopilin PulG
MTVLGIVMSGITGALVSATRHETALNQEFQAQESVRLALSEVRSDLHCGSAISPTSGAASAITVVLPTGCRTGLGSYTWCTVAAGTRFDLWRVPGTVCSTTAAGARRWASALLAGSPFTPDATVHAGAPALPDVAVDLRVAAGVRSYRLADTIYLRNGTRQ